MDQFKLLDAANDRINMLIAVDKGGILQKWLKVFKQTMFAGLDESQQIKCLCTVV